MSPDLQCPVGSNKKLIQLYPVPLISEDQLEREEIKIFIYFLPNFSALNATVRHIRNHINVLFTVSFPSESAIMVSRTPKMYLRGRSCRLMIRKREYVIPTVTRPTRVFLQRLNFLSQQSCFAVPSPCPEI